MLKIMDKVELKDETAILPNPCYGIVLKTF
jgi:hypothetical protein